ncbi:MULTISPECIES: glucose 1-dehydrogenase [Nocardiaceae]|jgi:NAD(P)-dependent dehydrogenase (short-subunit alcohol dehydrogenase family)|uniref:glucose 1-dehydrogenase n=1 Tax=Nocardiaceae TaxID=85025 RepID=UPI00055A9886|nr:MULTISPECIES: glucose 1-dehydrogenase [Rhodococcus]OZD59251.1 3-oxoacyl-ACP reductase [Rhodococcus sp. 06-1059B-a]OZF04781.1 3-oxoacyl-ACP reductase [Rhodococcus sp. 15-1189-1-1a]OZF07951.1 3-oxoacyl-ACP reductase [Rhodococcus sp. 15-1154-1]OZF19045.1 3-oxoacyl-ACP reductase [Rhodococcus sp. 14-2686-1-2]OZF55310.1 3-oxoacyl-ACP reductase [Rhodococcus sp. 14-2470-1a]
MADQFTKQDPTTSFPMPERADQDEIEHPGLTADLVSAPDHGEASYRGAGRLDGRKALVTGGDSGIGRAVALAFAREGADVVIGHLPAEAADAQVTVDLIESAGRSGVAVACDLTDESECIRLVDSAVDALGGLDIVVNNAAFQMARMGGIAEISSEQFDRVLKTNLYALFWISKRAVEIMTAGATIINTTSIQASNPSPELLDYATTKAGIVAFTKGLSGDLASRGIRVNAVAPGPIWTPLIPATMPAGKYEQFGETVPLGRPGQPAELAPAYVFLASNESSYITGETIAVTGGTPFN